MAGLQFSTCFARIAPLLSDLLQGLTALDYRNVHTSSLNKSVSFELCKQVSTLTAILFISIDLFVTEDSR